VFERLPRRGHALRVGLLGPKRLHAEEGEFYERYV